MVLDLPKIAPLGPGLVFIPLRNRAREVTAVAVVDECDHGLAALTWHRSSDGYVRRSVRLESGRVVQLYLAPEIMGVPRGDAREVDHIDGDPLNNRRSNLRVGTRAENAQNKPSYGGTSRHRGVCWNAELARWQAYGMLNRKMCHLGFFDDEDTAARAAANFRRTYMTHANETRSVRGEGA